MNKRDIRRAELAVDLLSPPPPEIVNAQRLRDVVEYLWQQRGLRKPSEITAAIRRFRRTSEALQRAKDVPRRVERMVAQGELDDTPPPPAPRRRRRDGAGAQRRTRASPGSRQASPAGPGRTPGMPGNTAP